VPKPSAFSGLKLVDATPSSVDQRLFQSPSDPPEPKPSKEPPSEGTDEGTAGRPDGLRDERPKGRKFAGRTRQVRAIGLPGTPSPHRAKRIVEHRPYDFYQDQVRWLNRKKLELQEQYGKLVPATAMVQLAVDLIIADFEINGDHSQLVSVLIKDERPSVRPFGGTDEGTFDVPEVAENG